MSTITKRTRPITINVAYIVLTVIFFHSVENQAPDSHKNKCGNNAQYKADGSGRIFWRKYIPKDDPCKNQFREINEEICQLRSNHGFTLSQEGGSARMEAKQK